MSERDFYDTERSFQYATNIFFNNLVSSEKGKEKTVELLYKKVVALASEKEKTQAIAKIISNLTLIKYNIDQQPALKLVEILLDYNAWQAAEDIFKQSQIEADVFTISSINFLFAKYYFKRKDWRKSYPLLQESISLNQLNENDTHHAYLMMGIILQYNIQHRDAVNFYKKVPEKSNYYFEAQINTATAYIRQGWWTDAYIIINHLIHLDSTKISNVKKDRLHSILAYSMFNNAFYRNAREKFRNIGTDSPYTNTALLGIALSTAGQKDYHGALNALKRLQNKPECDLPCEESSLLIPFMYQKLKKIPTASSEYKKSITYYQEKIDQLNKLNNINKGDLSSVFKTSKFKKNKESSILIGSDLIHYSDIYPDLILKNYMHLLDIKKHLSIKDDNHLIDITIKKHEDVLIKVVYNLVEMRKEHLNSYLNQARYALARLYDGE